MGNQANKVRVAVQTAPYLLNTIKKSQGFNKNIYHTTVNRLLPYRTSVEIEHCPIIIGPYNNWDTNNCSHPLYKLYKSHNGSRFPLYGCDLDSKDGKIFIHESKISVKTDKDLVEMYNILESLKTYTPEDEDGSIHIHVDISNWYNMGKLTSQEKIIRYMGAINIKYSSSNEVCNFINNMLNKAAMLFDFDIKYVEFDYEKGYVKSIADKIIREDYCFYDFSKGNKRAIYFDGLVDSLRPKNIIRDPYKITSIFSIDQTEKRKRYSVLNGNHKLNWINFRLAPNTIEFRLGKCSLEYDTIMSYMIGCNKLTKEFLNFIDYIGRKAIKVDGNLLI